MSFVSATSATFTCVNSAGSVSCTNNAPLAGPSSSTITLTVLVNSQAASIQNTATLTGGGGTVVTNQSTDTVNVNQPAGITNVTSTFANERMESAQWYRSRSRSRARSTVTGTPQLALNSGGTASYTSGSGTATLTFTYTVAAGQSSADLDYNTTSSLTLNGGTINDAGSLPAALTLPAPGGAGSLGGNKNIVIAIPNLNIAKVHTGTAFTSGQNGSYTITVTNTVNTPTTATVTVTDILPAGLTFVSATGTNWSCVNSSGTVTCTSTAPIPASSSASVTLTVAVNGVAASIQNTATLAGGGGTVGTASSTDTVNISQQVVITNVTSSTADGTYSTGAVIPITVSFSSAVTVTGTPTLARTRAVRPAIRRVRHGHPDVHLHSCRRRKQSGSRL